MAVITIVSRVEMEMCRDFISDQSPRLAKLLSEAATKWADKFAASSRIEVFITNELHGVPVNPIVTTTTE